jgi:hypothetical protein
VRFSSRYGARGDTASSTMATQPGEVTRTEYRSTTALDSSPSLQPMQRCLKQHFWVCRNECRAKQPSDFLRDTGAVPAAYLFIIRRPRATRGPCRSVSLP